MTYQYSDNYANHRHKPEETPEPPVHLDHSMHPADATFVEAVSNKKEYQKFAGVVLLLVACATIMSFVLGFDWQEWMRWFMAGTFIIFGSFKLMGYEMFILAFPSYDLLAKRFKLYNFFYPFIELFLGFLFAADVFPLTRDILTLAIMSVGAYGVLKALPRGNDIRCACLGNVIKLPLSTVTLWEDVVMAVMALIMLIGHFVL
jgi:hypothetical protein